MAQANSAQREPSREPSMEEILASIRRIIEDGDPVRSSPAARHQPDPVEPAQPISNTPSFSDNDDTALRRPEPQLVRETQEQLRGGLAEGPATESQLRGAVPSLEPVSRAAPADEDFDYVRQSPVDRWRPEEVLETQDATSRRLEEEPLSRPSSDLSVTAAPADIREPAPRPMERSERPGDIQADAAGDSSRLSILSPKAGRQVAAAFGELSEAFEASRRRSFDEIAEEMMRPMLQDWLDNNLPRLVEKLVREEIERIARGG